MSQDYYDILQPFDYIVEKLDDNKATLGLEYIAQNDEDLLWAFPSVLVQAGHTEREIHTTAQFRVVFHIDLWVFHADLTVDVQTRSRKDIQLTTDIRKLLHADRTLGGHIIHGFVDGEFSGLTGRVVEDMQRGIISSRLTWSGENRVPFEAS